MKKRQIHIMIASGRRYRGLEDLTRRIKKMIIFDVMKGTRGARTREARLVSFL